MRTFSYFYWLLFDPLEGGDDAVRARGLEPPLGLPTGS